MEACCEPDSLLSKRIRFSKNREVVCITKEDDFTSDLGLKKALAPLSGQHDAVWLSCPCTGGSKWIDINWGRGIETQNKIRTHWDLFHRIWDSFEVLARQALRVGARVFVEWPRGCYYWKEPRVMHFLNNYNFQFADFDGCMYGLKATGGKMMDN